jgi:hypothetical protein
MSSGTAACQDLDYVSRPAAYRGRNVLLEWHLKKGTCSRQTDERQPVLKAKSSSRSRREEAMADFKVAWERGP